MSWIAHERHARNPSRRLPISDLILWTFIVGLGIHPLRADWRIADDRAARRRELQAREREAIR